MGVALTSCTVPAAGKPTFQVGPDEMEMGVGIHGEPGRRRVKMVSADDIAAGLTGAVPKDLSLKRGQEVILLVNGFGGTPLLELYVMVGAAQKVLAGSGIKAVLHLPRSYVTSLRSRWPGARSRSPRPTRRRWRCGTRRCIRRRCGGECRGRGANRAAPSSAACRVLDELFEQAL